LENIVRRKENIFADVNYFLLFQKDTTMEIPVTKKEVPRSIPETSTPSVTSNIEGKKKDISLKLFRRKSFCFTQHASMESLYSLLSSNA
jgi:hypothetical protein